MCDVHLQSTKKARLSVKSFDVLLRLFAQFSRAGIYSILFQTDFDKYPLSEDAVFAILGSIIHSTQSVGTFVQIFKYFASFIPFISFIYRMRYSANLFLISLFQFLRSLWLRIS